MPTYEYECEACGIHFDCLQPFTAEPVEECPECDGHVHRVFRPPAIVFKGSGFYKTDYGSTSSPARSGKPEKGSEVKSERETEAAKKKAADSPTD